MGPRRTAVPASSRCELLSDPLRKITSWPRSSFPTPTTRSTAPADRTCASSAAGRWAGPTGPRRATGVAALAAALLAAVVLVGLIAGSRALLAPLAEHAPAGPAAASSATPHRWWSSPGDTIWTIARRAQPDGDVRPLVDRLVAAHGSGPLHPGRAHLRPELSARGLSRPWPGRRSVARVRCPACGNLDDRVVDSRPSEDGTAIRRRRECAGCGRRFTTFERADELPLSRGQALGLREPFDRDKIVAGLRAATKNRPVTSGR